MPPRGTCAGRCSKYMEAAAAVGFVTELSVTAGSLRGEPIRISCILAIPATEKSGGRKRRGAKGHINPCQAGPNYLSPCANKHSPGQPVGGRSVVCEVRQGRERRCSLTLITLPLISPPRPLSSLLLRYSPVTVPAAAHGSAGDVKKRERRVFISHFFPALLIRPGVEERGQRAVCKNLRASSHLFL